MTKTEVALNARDIEAARRLAEAFIAEKGGGALTQQLGDGGSAVVFKWEQGAYVRALKTYDPRFLSSDSAAAERHRLELQRRLIGQHCESMVDILAVEECLGTCFLTMEFFAGQELKKVVGQVPDSAVPGLMTQLVQAVRFLDSFGLVHRDIKPENILVARDFGILKLLDLGVVREASAAEDRVDGTDQGERRPFIATAQYSSPEYLFRLEPPSTALWKALTLYQVGAVLHDLVCKRSLFDQAVAADNKYALAMAVMREAPSFHGASAEMAEWAALASRCLSKDSALRVQLVDWSEFESAALSPRERLKLALAARAATSDRAIVDATRGNATRRARRERVAHIVEELRRSLLSLYSPQVRVTELAKDEGRAGVFLSLVDVRLGIQLAIEFTWEAGIRENVATVRLAGTTTAAQHHLALAGERHPIGEIDIDGIAEPQLVDMLVTASSELLLKHNALVETDSATQGADLVALTWACKE